MCELVLTEEEREFILRRRDAVEADKYGDRLFVHVLKHAHGYMEWAKRNSDVLSCSNFIDGYGYEGDQVDLVYQLVSGVVENLNHEFSVKNLFLLPIEKRVPLGDGDD